MHTLLAVAATWFANVPQDPPAVAVVTIALDPKNAADRPFLAVAEAATKFHHAEELAWDGLQPTVLRAQLRAAGTPAAVLFFVRPERFDLMLHRRVLLTMTALDDDAFVDAAFGYFTARTGEALAAQWQRTEALHRDGLRSRVWHSAGVTSGMKSTTYAGHRSALERAAGFHGDSFYFGCIEQDPDVRTFVRAVLPKLAEAAVLEWSGNGDPQGIWLFDGNRNLDHGKHWEYSPTRVGDDPRGELPRLLASDVRTMQLPATIVWSGTCHSAATHRIWLEGDIVSTFGRAPRGTVHPLPLEQSLGLAFIDAGAVALLAPVGPNHGMSAMREAEFALQNGSSLGEAIKSTYDDLVLAARGALRLDIERDGTLAATGEDVMQGGGANRVLLGDPTLRPFPATEAPGETTTIERGPDGSITVRVVWAKGFHARAWDMFGSDAQRSACVPVRLAADELLPAACTAVRVEVLASGDDGPLPFQFTHAVFESFAGRRWLHLQANAPRAAVDGKAQRVEFRVTPAR